VQMEVVKVRHRESENREMEKKAEAPVQEVADPHQSGVTDLAGQAVKYSW